MAFLLPMLEGALPMLLGSLAGPTLTRVGTQIDQNISPSSYGGSRSGINKSNTRHKHVIKANGLVPSYGPIKAGKLSKRRPDFKGVNTKHKGKKGGSRKKVGKGANFSTTLPLSNDNITTSNQQV